MSVVYITHAPHELFIIKERTHPARSIRKVVEMDHHYVVGVNTELGPEEWKRSRDNMILSKSVDRTIFYLIYRI